MRNRGLLLAGVVVLVVAFLVFRGSGSEEQDDVATTTTTPTTQATDPVTVTSPGGTTATVERAPTPPKPAVKTVVVEGGKPKGGVQKLRFDSGERVRFRVQSDVADEIHVHGYDLMKDVEAGGSVAFAFDADREGGYEVELEGRGVQIAQLEVR